MADEEAVIPKADRISFMYTHKDIALKRKKEYSSPVGTRGKRQ